MYQGETEDDKADVILVWHWDSGQEDTLRGVFPATPAGKEDAVFLVREDYSEEYCPIGDDIRLCRGSFVQGAGFGPFEG